MPIHWTISKPTKLIVAVCKDAVTRADIEAYLDAIVVADVLSYRKIFDLTQATVDLPDHDMMALGARIRAYATSGEMGGAMGGAMGATMGPLAIVASTPESYERAHLFAALADAQRPIKIFSELHKARQWLDAEAPAG
jgi:hypothetical protein